MGMFDHWEIAEGLSVVEFDPRKHPRDVRGRFRQTLAQMAAGSLLRTPDGTTVRKRDDGTFLVRSSGAQKLQGSAEDAVKDVLDRSSRKKNPESIGGERKFRDFDEAAADPSTPFVDADDDGEPDAPAPTSRATATGVRRFSADEAVRNYREMYGKDPSPAQIEKLRKREARDAPPDVPDPSNPEALDPYGLTPDESKRRADLMRQVDGSPRGSTTERTATAAYNDLMRKGLERRRAAEPARPDVPETVRKMQDPAPKASSADDGEVLERDPLPGGGEVITTRRPGLLPRSVDLETFIVKPDGTRERLDKVGVVQQARANHQRALRNATAGREVASTPEHEAFLDQVRGLTGASPTKVQANFPFRGTTRVTFDKPVGSGSTRRASVIQIDDRGVVALDPGSPSSKSYSGDTFLTELRKESGARTDGREESPARDARAVNQALTAEIMKDHYKALSNISFIGSSLPEGFTVKKARDLPKTYDLGQAQGVSEVRAPDGTLLGYVGKTDFGGYGVNDGRIQIGTTRSGMKWTPFDEKGKSLRRDVGMNKNRSDALRQLGRYHKEHGAR